MSKLIPKEAIEDGFTQSEIDTLNECGYKWYLAYALRVKGVEFDHNFLFGSAWHEFQAAYWKTGGKVASLQKAVVERDPEMVMTTEDEAWFEFIDDKLKVLAEEYINFFRDKDFVLGAEVLSVEEIFELSVEFNGMEIVLKGRQDLKRKQYKKPEIWDHKTSQNISEGQDRGWGFRFQFMFYLWVDRQLNPEHKTNTLIVNRMRKPSIRLKQGELVGQYLQRLHQDIASDPSKYFNRSSLTLVKGQMDHFEKHVLDPKLEKISLIANPKTSDSAIRAIVFDMNTRACFSIYGKWCPFIEHCDKGKAVAKFHRRENKHPEL